MTDPDIEEFRRLMVKTGWITCSPEFIDDVPICSHTLCLLERIIDRYVA